ncbi:Uncharacterised protein [Pseudomonas aeruginosa]|nr:Uncharacterised protein [Pseudomonas aeruginosa]
MFQSTEQALAVAYWMFEHQPGPKSSTAMVIDGLRERFDRSFIEHLPSGLSPHEWQAQAVMTVRFAQRQLAAHPLELAVVRAEFARGRDFVLGLAALRDWLKPGADPIEQRATLALLMRMFRRPPSSIPRDRATQRPVEEHPASLGQGMARAGRRFAGARPCSDWRSRWRRWGSCASAKKISV